MNSSCVFIVQRHRDTILHHFGSTSKWIEPSKKTQKWWICSKKSIKFVSPQAECSCGHLSVPALPSVVMLMLITAEHRLVMLSNALGGCCQWWRGWAPRWRPLPMGRPTPAVWTPSPSTQTACRTWTTTTTGHWGLELSTNLREVSQCPEKATTGPLLSPSVMIFARP